jgi:hypothetical protein
MSSRRVILLLAVVAAVAVVVRWRSEPERTEVGVTRELAGRWVTADPRWADRFLEITPGEVVFGQGEEGEARYRIEAVYRVEPSEKTAPGSAYLIRYRGPDPGREESELEVSVASGELHLANQPGVRWTPEP